MRNNSVSCVTTAGPTAAGQQQITISKEFFFGRLFLFVDSKWAVCRHLTYLSGLDNDLLSLLLSGANRYNSKSRAARAALQLIRHFLSLSRWPPVFSLTIYRSLCH